MKLWSVGCYAYAYITPYIRCTRQNRGLCTPKSTRLRNAYTAAKLIRNGGEIGVPNTQQGNIRLSDIKWSSRWMHHMKVESFATAIHAVHQVVHVGTLQDRVTWFHPVYQHAGGSDRGEGGAQGGLVDTCICHGIRCIRLFRAIITISIMLCI